jgi:acyl carrier protein
MTEKQIDQDGLLQALLDIVNTVRENKGVAPLATLTPEMRLREDLGFDSLDLAELTARLDQRFKVDVFADGLVHTVGEIAERLRREKADI